MSEAHQFNPNILREYDIRGIVGETIGADDYRAIGRALGTLTVKGGGKTAVVGYDGRLSSPELEAALVEGFKACGLTVYRVGLGPSPMLYYAGKVLNADVQAMVTGSHNPPDYNGIKMGLFGKSFFGQQIQDLGRLAASGDFVDGDGEVIDRPIQDDYVDRIFQDYNPGKELTVVWDAGNGAAGDVLVDLAKKLPGEHILLNEKIDGTFPAHHPDPTVEKNLDQLKAAVAAEGADLGIGFDGDGDRIGVIDGKGRVLWGDQLMCVLAREVLADEPGATIITDVKASQVFVDEIKRLGGNPLIWKTGHSLIKTKMEETKAPLAGEMSAHIFFKHRYYGYDDAIYTAVRLLSILTQSENDLCWYRDQLPQMINTPELRFDCSDELKFKVIEQVRDNLKGVGGIDVLDLDGVRVTNDDGWWLLRASNTQAVLVARCESATEEGLGRLKETLVENLAKVGVEAPNFD